jgi:flagellar basal body-associated protein FliL
MLPHFMSLPTLTDEVARHVIYPRSFNLARLTNNLADAGKRFSQAPVRIRLSQHNKHNKNEVY